MDFNVTSDIRNIAWKFSSRERVDYPITVPLFLSLLPLSFALSQIMMNRSYSSVPLAALDNLLAG